MFFSIRQQVIGETVLVRAAELLPQGREIEGGGSHLRSGAEDRLPRQAITLREEGEKSRRRAAAVGEREAAAGSPSSLKRTTPVLR